MMLDSETTALAPREDHVEEHDDELRLLLRLLSSTTVIEGILRTRLRKKFDVTAARFDLMAQLDRLPNGMNLSDISEKMMVSNGNVTGLVDRLVETGHIDRRTSIYDGRVKVIRLTKVGRAEFRKMATAHKKWVAEIFSDLEAKDVRELMRLLDKTKISARNAVVA
jgi:DNA-binding MarR family transcriptional regulator